MDDLAARPSRKIIISPMLSILVGTLLAAGCGGSDSTTDVSQCSEYPSTSRVDSAGVTQWWWHFHWSAENLAAACATYGIGAKMVLEVDVPSQPTVGTSDLNCTTDEVVNGTTRTCTIQGAYRFEADCTAGQMLFELPSQNTFHGWYHIEGALVTTTMRSLLGQGVECPRSVFVRSDVPAAPSPQDAGAPAQDGGDVDSNQVIDGVDGGACVWPESVTQSSDASIVGCWARATHGICEVPNGGSVDLQTGVIRGPDGAPVDNACHNLCSESEYALDCVGDPQSTSPFAIPEPDPSLGCTVIPIPTGPHVLYYCCPCVQGPGYGG